MQHGYSIFKISICIFTFDFDPLINAKVMYISTLDILEIFTNRKITTMAISYQVIASFRLAYFYLTTKVNDRVMHISTVNGDRYEKHYMAFDCRICIWLWYILKFNVMVIYISTVNSLKLVTDLENIAVTPSIWIS